MSAVPSVTRHTLEASLLAAEAEGRDASVKRWLRFAHVRPGDVVELQALKVPFGNKERTYIAHASTTAEVLRLLDEAKQYKCPGLYFIANRVNPAVATRLGPDKWNPAASTGSNTTDRDIICRTVLFVDVDSERPTNTSATEAELAAAIAVATDVHTWLARFLGGTDSLGYGASGNGRGIYVALEDLAESEAAGRVKAILVGLDALFSTARAKIDTAVSDAKRLVPAHGTMKRKGVATIAERPHRMTTFICADRVRRVGTAQLDGLIEALRAELDDVGVGAIDRALGVKVLAKTTASSSDPSRSIIESPFSRANAVDVGDVLGWLGQLDGERARCPGCGEADSGVAIVGNGLKCSHARCADKGIRAGFRTPVDLVAEVHRVSAKDAVSLMAERFGFEGFRAPSSTTEPAAPARREIPRPGDRVRALAGLGPVVRLATGIPTLDVSCRGGIPTRRLVVVGGAPGSGKTSLGTNWAWRWAKGGIVVGILAVDEGPEGAITRIAQLEGMSPEKLEERDPNTLARLAEMLDATPLILLDGEDEAGTVEGVAELVAKRAAGGVGVLVVDSIQTVRAAGTETVDSPRERVDAVVRALKSARDRHGLLVIATCELSRGAYRSRSLAETINDLAAFKESGSVEYAAQTALVLRSVPDEASLVDVTVPKNRAYRRDPFRLRMDHSTTAYVEVDMPEPSVSSSVGAPRFDAVRRGVVQVVSTQELRSARSVVRAVREAGHRFRDADIFDAVKVMQDEGTLTRDGQAPFRITIPNETEETTV